MERTQGHTNQVIARTKLVIVGAGIAGLAAAKTLKDANFKDYLLIEAQNEIGGRIHSIPWNTSWIESGAQFLHGDQSQLAQLCHLNDLLSDDQCKDGQGIFVRENGIKVDELLVEEIDDLVRTTLENYEDYENMNVEIGCENIGKLLRTSFKKHSQQKNDSPMTRGVKKEIFDWNVRFLVIDNSCLTLDGLSTKFWGKFKYVGGSDHLSFKAGYHSVIKLIDDELNEKNVRLNTSVDLIEWQQVVDDIDSPLTLHLSDNTKILSDSVIVTCSLGYLKENYKKMFVPTLPTLFTQTIECLGFGLINKIFLDFGIPWWNMNSKGFQFLWKERSGMFSNNTLAAWIRDLTGFDILPDHEGVLLGWVGGQGAYIIETLSEQQVANDCENLLRYYLKSDNVPPVKRCLRTQWHANKYVRGSYSHISTRCDNNEVTPAKLAEPIWGRIVGNHGTKVGKLVYLTGPVLAIGDPRIAPALLVNKEKIDRWIKVSKFQDLLYLVTTDVTLLRRS